MAVIYTLVSPKPTPPPPAWAFVNLPAPGEEGVINVVNAEDFALISELMSKNWTHNPLDVEAVADGMGMTSGRFASDYVVASDAEFAVLSKFFSDGAVADDIISRTLLKVLADAVAADDSIATIQARFFSDSAILADLAPTVLSKFFSDNAVASDAVRQILTQFFQDSQVVSDSTSTVRSVQADTRDSATATDAISRTLLKAVTDGALLSEAVQLLRRMTFDDFAALSDSAVATRIVPSEAVVLVENILTQVTDMSARAAGAGDASKRVSEIIDRAVRTTKVKGLRR